MARATRICSRLWGHHDFLLLWGGQGVSMLGSEVTRWALPFAAIFTLNATPLGALAATQLGALYGVRPVVLLAGAGTLFAFLVILLSPARALRRHPSAVDEASFVH